MKTITLLSVLLLTSCLSSNYKPTTTYDLQPAHDAAEIHFMIEEIGLDGPYSKKLTFKKGNVLEEKEYHRWSDSPNALLKRYWTLSKTSPNAKLIKKAIIRVFEFNRDRKTAVIIIDIHTETGYKRLEVSEAYSNETNTDCVAAMKIALVKLTEKISSIK
jgi:hypothetical protein